MESELISRARQGDAAAFEALVKPHLARAYRLAYLIIQDDAKAADAFQEALLRAYRALGSLRSQAFYPWLSRITVNEAVKEAQRHRRLSFLPLPEQTEPTTPEGLLLEKEERQLVWQAVSRLSPDHRSVIVLRYLEELSEAEMAEVLGVSTGTVKSRLHRARKSLEVQLGATSAPLLKGGLEHERS